MSACKVPERYKTPLEEKSYVEVCQKSGLLTAVHSSMTCTGFSRELKTRRRVLSLCASCRRRDVVFSLYVPEGPAGYAAEQQLELSQPGMRLSWRGCDCAAKVRSSTISPECLAAEAMKLRQAWCSNFCRRWVSFVEPKSASRYLSVLSLAARALWVLTSHPQRLWDAPACG